MKKPRVHWTQAIRDSVNNQFKVVAATSDATALKVLIRKAQLFLPEDSRREHFTPEELQQFKQLLAEVRPSEVVTTKVQTQAQTQALNPETFHNVPGTNRTFSFAKLLVIAKQYVELQDALLTLRVTDPVAAIKQLRSQVDSLTDYTTRRLIEAKVKSVVVVVEGKEFQLSPASASTLVTGQSLEVQQPQPQPLVQPEVQKPVTQKPLTHTKVEPKKVVIVGMRQQGQQHSILAQKFPKLNLVFIDTHGKNFTSRVSGQTVVFMQNVNADARRTINNIAKRAYTASGPHSLYTTLSSITSNL